MDTDIIMNNEVDTMRENSIDWDKVEHDCHTSQDDGCKGCINGLVTE